MTFHAPVAQAYDGLDPWAQLAVRVALVFLVGYGVLWALRTWTDSAFKRAGLLDDTSRRFLVGVVSGLSWIVLGAVVLAAAGVNVAALIGGLALGGFVVGFAVKDVLANLAAGLVLLVNRPFHVDEVVTVSGQTGTVVELGMALTVLRQFDGRIVTLPNGTILDDPILNHTRSPTRRVEVRVGIAYGDDVDVARRAILEALADMPACLAEPAPEVVVVDLAESAVVLEVRAWSRREDFGPLINGLRPLVLRALEAAGLTIPFPQRDVHVVQRVPGETLGRGPGHL